MKKTILTIALFATILSCGSTQNAFGSSSEQSIDRVEQAVTQFVNECFSDDVKIISAEKPVSHLLTAALKAELELRKDLLIPLNGKSFKVRVTQSLPNHHSSIDSDKWNCDDLDNWLHEKLYSNNKDLSHQYGLLTAEALTTDDTSAMISYVSYHYKGNDKLIKIKLYSAN